LICHIVGKNIRWTEYFNSLIYLKLSHTTHISYGLTTGQDKTNLV